MPRKDADHETPVGEQAPEDEATGCEVVGVRSQRSVSGFLTLAPVSSTGQAPALFRGVSGSWQVIMLFTLTPALSLRRGGMLLCQESRSPEYQPPFMGVYVSIV